MRSFSRRFLFFLAVTGFVALAARATPMPLRDGEQLTYRVSWAVVPGAGEIKIEAQESPSAADRLIVTTSTSTRRLARLLLPFDATSESVFDLGTGKLLALHEISRQREKRAEHRVTFDYDKREAFYMVPGDADASRTMKMPEGNPLDLIMALLGTREWNLKEGEARDAVVLWNDEFYELTIHAARYEQLDTPLGSFRTLVLEPRMEKTAPKGMFKRGSSVRVWITQDQFRLPVKFDVEFKIGTGTAMLEYYQGPSSNPPAASARDHSAAPNLPATPAAATLPDAKDPRP